VRCCFSSPPPSRFSPLVLRPDPPQWSIQAGLPLPLEDEEFCEYVTRLGLDCPDLLMDLDLRLDESGVEGIANLRLATAIQKIVPDIFSAYTEREAKKWRR